MNSDLNHPKNGFRVAVAGGGPAGMMLGYLLARAGASSVVLEKHADFLRDFRGDTIHPSTLQVLDELGILDALLKRPHQKQQELHAFFGESEAIVGDFSHVPGRFKFLAIVPQWDFLNFIAEEAKRYPGFELKMETEAIGLIEKDGVVSGIRARAGEREIEIRARLTVAADGRSSVLRKAAGLEQEDLGAPMDVLWMRLSKREGDPEQTFGLVARGRFLAMIDRGQYWQCAFLIPKGSFDEIKARGMESFRNAITEAAPFLRERLPELKSWDDVKLLTVKVDRLRRWYKTGFLCIGDAAHAMSPIGGVGINLAVQDAVAAANILAAPCLDGNVTLETLRRVQKRREFPTKMTQKLQVLLQNRFVSKVLEGKNETTRLPLGAKLLNDFPFLRRIPARIVGIGFRPEHVSKKIRHR